ncbi:hypothetical protein JIN84_22690 [Luteolibacter yonseiensis]|uniref:Uncharacterized protein n=1 Tax=Luteolibacter yonseiensis TaxID=1144680 RepID=A0A934R7J4_9BACT|nr:hypothetical protein [Luteolibacter yonseiensis]MBK1818444.1 hypothetical protein [Luteolibacter yonseiensis]
MRAALIPLLIGLSLAACKQEGLDSRAATPVSETRVPEKPMIRSIRSVGTDDAFGVMLNGDRATFSQGSAKSNRINLPYAEGLKILEDFYAIPGIEAYRGKKSDNRQTSIHHLIHVYDEMPERYSEEWVDYVIPKDKVAGNPPLAKWFAAIDTLRERAGKGGDASRQPAP